MAHALYGGPPTEATVAHVLVSKYADQLPLYRQTQNYALQGIALDRSPTGLAAPPSTCSSFVCIGSRRPFSYSRAMRASMASST
jgi:hypothetical protein